MRCGVILDIACALICEDRSSDAGSAFDAFAVGIINGFLLENMERAAALGGAFEGIPTIGSLEEEFPYADRLASPCVYYLASRLIRDENADAAKELMARCDKLTGAIGTVGTGGSTGSGGSSDGDEDADVIVNGDVVVYPGSTIDIYAGVN